MYVKLVYLGYNLNFELFTQKKMRLLSNDLTVNTREASFISIVETSIAIILSIFLAVYYKSLIHVAVSATLAPILLLRSPVSYQYGVNLFEIYKPKPIAGAGRFSIKRGYTLAYLLIVSILVRITATLRFAFMGAAFILGNWHRIIFCTDIATRLEPVPGGGNLTSIVEKTANKKYDRFGISLYFLIGLIFLAILIISIFLILKIDAVKIFFDVAGDIFGIGDFEKIILFFILFAISPLIIILFPLFLTHISLFLIYFLNYIFRLSLKSTATIWLPLIFNVSHSHDDQLSTKEKVKDLADSELSRVLRWLSVLILGLFFWRLFIFPEWTDWWNKQSWTEILDVYIMPGPIRLWHIAAAANSSITLVAFFLFYDKAARRMKSKTWPEKKVSGLIKKIAVAQGIISSYTIFVGLLLTYRAVLKAKFPNIDFQLIPDWIV